MLVLTLFLILTQVVDHSGSVEEGADLIYSQVEKVIKQVQTVSNISHFINSIASIVCIMTAFNFYPHHVGVAGS